MITRTRSHVGYPESFRQIGTVPNMQFSVSEDGTEADIDVDYRSSRTPQALWNGHLTSADSDVRAGDNHDRHSSRWSGLVDLWREIFGNLPEKKRERPPALLSEPDERPTRLPPNRPPGSLIPELQDAAAEFLADWLVRRDIDEALEFVLPAGARVRRHG